MLRPQPPTDLGAVRVVGGNLGDEPTDAAQQRAILAAPESTPGRHPTKRLDERIRQVQVDFIPAALEVAGDGALGLKRLRRPGQKSVRIGLPEASIVHSLAVSVAWSSLRREAGVRRGNGATVGGPLAQPAPIRGWRLSRARRVPSVKSMLY